MKKSLCFLSIGLMIICTGAQSSAQVNLGALKNKVANKVKQEAAAAVKSIGDKNSSEQAQTPVQQQPQEAAPAAQAAAAAEVPAVSNAQPVAPEQTDRKVQPKGPKPADVDVKSNIEDVYAAFYYYQTLVEEAVQKKDISYLCSPDAQKPFEILYKVIMKHPQKNSSNTTKYNLL